MAKFKLNRKFQNLLMVILLILGVGILIYPDIADWWHSNQHASLLQEYDANVALMEAETIAHELERAQIFNDGLSGIHIEDPFVPGSGSVMSHEYYSILNFDGVMGRIEIPEIGVSLPIFHGTSDQVLERGVGHMENTPFPIGGYGNHAILTGHTGMVNMRLFTDLYRLRLGESKFFVQVLDHRIAYQVDSIDIVLPHEIEILYSDPNRDWITLVTCTPYGVNSHRLLVRGHRIEYIEGMGDEIPDVTTPISVRVMIVIGFSFVFILIIWFYSRKKNKITQDRRFNKQIEQEYEALHKKT